MPDSSPQSVISPKRVLIIKISSLGDILHTFPALDLLATVWPETEFDWLVSAKFANLPLMHPALGRIILFERERLGCPFSFPGACCGLVRDIRLNDYDLVIDFQGLMRSAVCGWLARTPRRIGFADSRESLAGLAYSERVTIPDGVIHAVERNLHLAAYAAAVDIPVISPPCRLVFRRDLVTAVDRILENRGFSGNGRVLGFVPGARWQSKRWPPAFFAEVVSQVAASLPDLEILVLGTKDDLPLALDFCAAAGEKAKIHNFCGDTGVPELLEMIRRCDGVLCNDSGPMHMAAIMGVPVFAMFGATDPARTGPYGEGHMVFQPELSCIHCLRRYCPQKTGRCHTAIDAGQVATSIIEKLQDRQV